MLFPYYMGPSFTLNILKMINLSSEVVGLWDG